MATAPLDNPSYFTLASGLTSPKNNNKNKFRLFKKKMGTTDNELFKSNTVNNRRQLRSLLRSVSSNSADSNQELLVLGEPRACDIAPPSPYLPNHKKRTVKRSSDMTDDLIYCPLATSEEAADSIYSEEEEVFVSDDCAKYYNIGREAGRRHSVGTYLNHERERALSIASSSKSCKEEVIVHATADGEIVRGGSVGASSRRSSRSTIKRGDCTKSLNMDDILIVSSKDSEAASLWVAYFTLCFEQYTKTKGRPVPKILKLGLEDITTDSFLTPAVQENISGVKLQILIVCPRFLDLVEERPIPSNEFSKCLRPDRTIAMLLGVVDDNLNDIHHAALPNYKDWQRHVVGQDQDKNFTNIFLTDAINILTKVTKQQHLQAIEERTSFSVMPKKVKQSQNRLIILLTEPLTKEDVVKVSINKDGEMVEIKSVKRRNPYTLKFVMPESCLEVSAIINVLVEKNGDLLGARPVKCESRLRELDQILRSTDSPLQFMCQTLGFSPSSKEQLDNWLLHNFQKNIPPDFNLLARAHQNIEHPHGRHLHGHEEYPTLLHFAARFGLERLAWQLLECPGGDMAIDVRNACDFTPAEMADKAGHTKLAGVLSGYMQMNEFSNMYSKLKEMSQTKQDNSTNKSADEPEVDEDEYLLPRCMEQAYCVPPPAKPVATTPTQRPITGYMDMLPQGQSPIPQSNTGTLPKTKDHDSHSFRSVTPSQSTHAENSTLATSTQNLHKYEDRIQNELLEIINDFKNNVFSLSEVEALVENWKKRNDVQTSFKDKQEQLDIMRQEYDRIQKKIKEEMKRPTPFERIKKFFGRSKSKEPETKTDRNDTSSINSEERKFQNFNNNIRPISSLSLQSTTSTSSSGRMSTLSGCSAGSFGDSGTHSDPEERKSLVRQPTREPEAPCYLIPPAPRPFVPKSKTISFPPFTPIDERAPFPVPREGTPQNELCNTNESDQYYIQFPPSGLPVNSLVSELKSKFRPTVNLPTTPEMPGQYNEHSDYQNIEEPMQEYVNVAPEPTETPIEAEYTDMDHILPEYMNVTISPKLPPRKA